LKVYALGQHFKIYKNSVWERVTHKSHKDTAIGKTKTRKMQQFELKTGLPHHQTKITNPIFNKSTTRSYITKE